MTLLAINGVPLATGGGGALSTPQFYYESFQRADGPVGRGSHDMHDFWPTNFGPCPIIENTWGSTQVDTTPGYTLLFWDFEVADNFRIVHHHLVEDDPPVSALNQVSPALFVDETVPDLDMHMGLQPVGDFTLGDDCYWNNICNTTQQNFNDNYETLSLTWPDPPFPSYTAGAIFPAVWDVRVVGGDMSFRVNGQVLGDPLEVPAEFVGRTKHGLSGRTGNFPQTRVSNLFCIEHWAGPL